jgi:ArsR family transcriptional regulator
MTTDQSESCCAGPIGVDTMPVDLAERSMRMFKALADDTRYAIFRLIASQPEPICACDVVDRFTVSQPTIAHHLKVLREAGLITVTRRGVWAYYEADPRGVDELSEVTRGFANVRHIVGAR